METIENQIFYSLSYEDIQTVAMDEVGRELSKEELNKVAESVSEKINWYEIISFAIEEKIQTELDPASGHT